MSARLLTARFELVTPAFASGINQCSAELRVEAIIGQLRRWWWAQASTNPGFSSDENSRDTTFARALFGAAGDEEGARGQGAFLVSLRTSNLVCEDNEGGLQTLLGQIQRPIRLRGARPGVAAEFEIGFLLRPKRPAKMSASDDEVVEGLTRALKLWGLLGGIGAGQRRGFGSVRLLELQDNRAQVWRPPELVDGYAAAIKDVLRAPIAVGTSGMGFGAFSSQTPEASIWIGECNACMHGLAVLERLQSELLALNDSLPKPLRHPYTLLANQSPNARAPSPFHFHVTRLDARKMALVMTILPYASYRASCAERVLGSCTGEIKGLVQRLGLECVLDRPTP